MVEIKPLLNFSDGTYAFIKTIISNKKIEDTDGNEKFVHEFYLRPTPRTKEKWNLKEKEDQDFMDTGDNVGYYKKQYPVEYCQPLDISPDKAVWHLHCDWEGNHIDIFDGMMKIWINKIHALQKQVKGLEMTKNAIGYEFIKLAQDPVRYAKKYGENWKKVMENMNIVISPPAPPSGGGGSG